MKMTSKGEKRGKSGRGRKGSGAEFPDGATILFPGPEGWELWSGPPAHPVCAGPAEEPRRLKPVPGCSLALPSRAFFSLPLWVPVVEESPAREQTQIKLEMKGLLGANPEAAVWNFEGIRREQILPLGEGEPMTRQLESTAVLSAPFPENWLVEEATRHEPAGRMLRAPGPGSWGGLRRELGRWVADFYQGGKWLHTQPLLSPMLDASAAIELNTTAAQLEGEGILSPSGKLEGWMIREDGVTVSDDFAQALDLPLHTEAPIVPRPPVEAWNLPPPALTERRLQREEAGKRKKILRLGSTLYGVVLILGMALFAWPFVQLALVQAELRKIGAQADQIRATAAVWREAGPWLQPRLNALELLWQVSRPLVESDPPLVEGVRLTVFDLTSKRLRLEGEGKDLEKVEKYFQLLKSEPGLAGFSWKNPQPQLLPNGNARFVAEGMPPGMAAPTEEGGENANPDTP